MNICLYIFLNLTIGAGAVIGWYRYSKIDSRYAPLVWLLTLGSINELLGAWLYWQNAPSSLPQNLFLLTELWLTLYLFHHFSQPCKLVAFIVTGSVLTGIWIAEWAMMSLSQYFSFTAILYSGIFGAGGLQLFSRQLVYASPPLLKQPQLLLAIGIILSGITGVLIECWWLLGSYYLQQQFQEQVIFLLTIVNLFIHLLFTIVILWSPLKPGYIIRH